MNEYMEPGTYEPVTEQISSNIELYLWPDISPTVTWVAFLIGFLFYIIGYFAGGKLSPGKIAMCIVITSIIGFLSRAVLNPVMLFLTQSLNIDPHSAYILASTLWMIFIIGAGVMIYETFTITAEEAHPD